MSSKGAQPPAVESHHAQRLADVACAQHGVISRAQLAALGLQSWVIGHEVRVGRLHRVHRGVYAVGHRRISREGRWIAAVLAVGADAALSHASAAALWGVRTVPAGPIDVTLPTRNGRKARAGVTVHRARLSLEEITVQRSIPVTTPARTLLDLAEHLTPVRLARAVNEAERLRLFDLKAIDAVLRANPGRRGATPLTVAVAQHRPEPQATRSELEDRFIDLCRLHRLPPPRVNALVHGLEVDFLWPDSKLIVETDGHALHGTRAAFERDRARDVELATHGLRVVRFTYRQVEREAATVVRALRALLA